MVCYLLCVAAVIGGLVLGGSVQWRGCAVRWRAPARSGAPGTGVRQLCTDAVLSCLSDGREAVTRVGHSDRAALPCNRMQGYGTLVRPPMNVAGPAVPHYSVQSHCTFGSITSIGPFQRFQMRLGALASRTGWEGSLGRRTNATQLQLTGNMPASCAARHVHVHRSAPVLSASKLRPEISCTSDYALTGRPIRPVVRP